MSLALEHDCKSVAFPLISSGVYGYPKAEASEVAVSKINSFLKNNNAEDILVYLVVFDEEAFRISRKYVNYLENN